MSFKRARRVAVVAGSATAFAVAVAPTPASAAAFVLTPGELQCFFEPGDVPGVDVFFPGTCSQVVTPSGNSVIVGRGELPAGYTLDETFVGSVPCFGGTGRIVATRSGQVTATCPSHG
jgi:hypothetical protein